MFEKFILVDIVVLIQEFFLFIFKFWGLSSLFNWENILLFILGEFWNFNFLLKYLHFLWKLLVIWEFPADGNTDNSDWKIEIENKCPKGF